MRVETIGDCTLYLGDCRDILPTLGKVDAVVTDPPYGLGDLWQGGGGGQKSSWKFEAIEAKAWDGHAPAVALSQALSMADHGIVWGGNYFPLPPRRGWLIWDKIVRNFTTGVAELAWTTLDQPIKAFNYAHGQLASEGKVHPTQKPLDLMLWCVGFLPRGSSVLDPFMGSGTTGVACALTDRVFTGIEREPTYFDIACRRIEEAYKQPRLFAEPVAKPVQDSLL